MENKNEFPQSPFAKYQGVLPLGENEVDCYVSDTGLRLISMRSTVKAIANIEGGALERYIDVKALQPYLNNLNDVKERFTAKFKITKSFFPDSNAVEEKESVKPHKSSKIKGSAAEQNQSISLDKFVELTIPGNPQKAKCLTSNQFINLCRAYVAASSDKALTTDRQREIALKES